METMVVRLREHSSTSSGSPILPSIRITDYDRRTPSQPHVSSDSESSILGHSFGQFGPELQPEVNTRMWLGVPGASYGSPNLVGMYILHHKSMAFLLQNNDGSAQKASGDTRGHRMTGDARE